MGKRVVLAIGTKKGVFVAESAPARKKFTLRGPHGAGVAVYSALVDNRGAPTIYASSCNPFFGMKVLRSTDLGKSFKETKSAPAFPEGDGRALANIWSIAPGDGTKELFAGVEPASLFRSTDAGKSWEVVRGLLDHPHRQRWTPGGGGLCLHTIVRDRGNVDRMWIAISSGGVYRTVDAGRTWVARNAGIRAEFLPEKYPEFGQCVHKVVHHPSRAGRLFAQNHWGLYRSDDAGDSWQDIARGVPSDFGFAMAIHPHEPDTVYIVPIESDQVRVSPEGKLRVYRTRNAGRSWEPLTRGLPQRHAYDIVLRDALATDTLDPAGVYFGTRNGKLYASRDGGSSWRLAVDGLPSITCVRTAVVDERKPAPRAAARRSARR